MKEDHPHLAVSQLSKIVNGMWQDLSVVERRTYLNEEERIKYNTGTQIRI